MQRFEVGGHMQCNNRYCNISTHITADTRENMQQMKQQMRTNEATNAQE